MQEQIEIDDIEQPLVLEMVVPDGVLGVRLDKQLALMMPEHSRARLQGWIESGCVKVNHHVQQRVRALVCERDVLSVVPQPSEQELAFTPEPIEFDVVAESAQWVVVNKRAGLVVHPGAGNWHGTLLNGLLHRFPELAGVARAGIVHRLDKDTSGLMVVARTEIAQTSLVRQLQARTVRRDYTALVHGTVHPVQGRIDRPIGRDAKVAVRMSVDRSVAPKEAITEYEVIRCGQAQQSPITQVQCRLQTGRTHQIRVHLASLGYPLIGDVLYGGKLLGDVTRQMLHARQLAFEDPVSGQLQRFETELPADMTAWMQQIQWSSV